MTNAKDEEFFKQRGFGMRIGFGRRPVLIVIDMINAFTDRNMMLGADLDSQIAVINPLIDVAHERNIPVIFTTVFYEESDLRDAGIWALKQKGVTTLRANTKEVDVDARLHRGSKDAILSKKYASSFFGTDLVPRLLSHRADTLIIAGCTTSGCVRATAVDACQNGFRPMVVKEAVGDRSVAAHEQSLFDLQAKYADVVSTGETADYIRSLSA